MDKLVVGARLLLGLMFTVFGLNGFFNFLPLPPFEGAPGALIEAFIASGYLWPLIKGTEVACGVLLLVGRFVPLALTVLAPVVVNIVAFHLALDLAGIVVGGVSLLLGLFVAWGYRSSFGGVLDMNAKPD